MKVRLLENSYLGISHHVGKVFDADQDDNGIFRIKCSNLLLESGDLPAFPEDEHLPFLPEEVEIINE
jgi:hypothetical protein